MKASRVKSKNASLSRTKFLSFVLPHDGGTEIDMLAVTNHTFPKDAEVSLLRFGHHTLRLPPHPALPAPVASHPDMLLFFAPEAIFCTKSYCEIAKNELKDISLHYGAPIRCIDAEYGCEYPRDVFLNALPLGSKLFCNTKTVAKELLALGFSIFHVNQGYTKCSALPLGARALITADDSITARAKEDGIDVLQIQAGHISLCGYDYGFIGGCASFTPKTQIDSVFFTGDLSKHPDGKIIESFCQKHGYRTQSLTNTPLCDTGTIFLI